MINKSSKFLLVFLTIFFGYFTSIEAKTYKKKTNHKTHNKYKASTHKRKSRHFKHGNGPDLKSITIHSPYTEELNNGINTLETTEPTL